MNCYLSSAFVLHTPWAYEVLQEFMNPDTKVSVLYCGHSDEWAWDESSMKDKVVRSVIQTCSYYRIPRSAVSVLDPEMMAPGVLQKRIEESDVLFLCGDTPDSVLSHVRMHGLESVLQKYQGLIVCDGMASLAVIDECVSHYDETYVMKGLGLIEGIALDPFYVEDMFHLGRMIRILEDEGKSVVSFNTDGAILIRDGYYDLLGNAFVAGRDDIDRIYAAYEDARSRYEYYGDNGNY